MRRVVAYCKRHLAQEEKGNDGKDDEELRETKSYRSLKNWCVGLPLPFHLSGTFSDLSITPSFLQGPRCYQEAQRSVVLILVYGPGQAQGAALKVQGSVQEGRRRRGGESGEGE